MVKIIKTEFNGELMQFNDAGWFNATAAADRFGKRIDHWLANAETKEYIEKLNTRNVGDLIKTKRGKTGGTWLHPKLAIVFARWLSVDFAIWCDEQIDEIIHGTPERTDWKRVRHAAASSYKVMSAMLDMKRQLDGKETKPFHYANEAKLVNWVLTGEFKPVDRDSLTDHDLDLLAKLEELNSLLIGQGVDRDTRKDKPLTAVAGKRKQIA
ncbi:MAG: KilA-N domain-containing protein [Methyloprofundus sp.]|nr:KilA-N domain-containing protein [Methyloprofundus sp.]